MRSARQRLTSRPTNRSSDQRNANRDAVRVLVALVFILFASIASREHDSPEKTLEQQEVAEAQIQQQQPQDQAPSIHRAREAKRVTKLPEVSIFSRLSGAISGAI